MPEQTTTSDLSLPATKQNLVITQAFPKKIQEHPKKASPKKPRQTYKK